MCISDKWRVTLAGNYFKPDESMIAWQNNERFDRSSCRIYMANKIWWWWYHSVTCQQCNARTHFIVHRFQPAVDAFKYYFIPRTILSWNAVYCLGLVGKSSKPAGSTEVFITRQHTDARYWYSKSVRLSVRPSVRNVPVSDENGLTYRHSFFTIR